MNRFNLTVAAVLAAGCAIADGGEFVNFSRLSSRLDKLAGIK